MKGPSEKDGNRRGSDVQAAFNEAAESLDLRIEQPTPAANRSVGIFIIPVQATPVIETDPADPEVDFGPDDEQAIRQLVKRWESTDPQNVPATWAACATEPAIAVADDWVAPITIAQLEDGLESEEFRQQLIDYPLYSPRKTSVDAIAITFIGNTSAAATYTFREEYTNGKIFAGNSIMILVKDSSNDWRATVFTKRVHFKNFRPVTVD